MISAERLRSTLNNAAFKTHKPEPWVEELHKLYDIRPQIEANISKLIVDNSSAHPIIEGIMFFETELGKEYNEFRNSVKHIHLMAIGDHICNWCHLNGYLANFQIDVASGETKILFVIKWFDYEHYLMSQ